MSAQQDLKFTRYSAVHSQPKGPGDARPTALQVVKDENLEGRLNDKVMFITGGSSGIGIETIRALAHTGAQVVVGVRNISKGQAVIDQILSQDQEIRKDKLELMEMDLNSLESIREAASKFLSKNKQLNVLVNNAGIGGAPFGRTIQGFESHFGVNHLAHFLLFQLLKPTLLASSTPAFKSRVVAVSSLMHRFSPVLLADPNFVSTDYDPAAAYASSKTANIWFTNYIDRLYGSQGLHGISVHPGGIETGLQAGHDPTYAKLMQDTMAQNPEILDTMKSPEQGAATTVLAAIGKAFDDVGGIYLDDCQVAPLHDIERDGIGAPGYAECAFDQEGEEKLWNMSLDLVGLVD